MSARAPETATSFYEAAETAKMPPFFGKNEWKLDITKIVTRTPVIGLPTIPEAEEEMESPVCENTTKTPIIEVKTRVHFAPYVTCHKRIEGIDYTYKMEPSYNPRGRLHQIELLDDEVFILKRREEKLMKMLGRKNKQIDRLETLNHMFTIFPLIFLIIAYVGICKYFSTK